MSDHWVELALNLLAEAIGIIATVFVINRIIKHRELQKSKRSIRYVKGKVAGTLSKLIFQMRPSSNWQDRLRKQDSNWDDYYGRILATRSEALNELEKTLDSHSYLLDADLRNDVFDMVSLLGSFTWVEFESGWQRDLWILHDTASSAVAIIEKAKETIQHHKLLENIGWSMHWRDGEPPKFEFGKFGIIEETQYSYYSKLLREAIEFRDLCHKERMVGKKGTKRE